MEIKSEIKNILSQDNGIEIFIHVKLKDEKYEILKLNALDELRDVLRNKLSQNLFEKFCSEEIKFLFLENYDEKKDTYCVINKKEYEGLNKICELDNINKYYKGGEGIIQGFIYKFGINTNFMILYENFYSMNLINKENIIMGFVENALGKPQFKLFDKNILKISADIHVMILNEYIISKDLKILESKFGYKKFIESISNKTINEVNEMDILADNKKINGFMDNYNNKKKMAKIKGSKVLKMDRTTIVKRIGEDEYYKNNVKIENGKIKIETKKDFKILLKLLNDDILKSAITSTTYDASSKKEMNDA